MVKQSQNITSITPQMRMQALLVQRQKELTDTLRELNKKWEAEMMALMQELSKELEEKGHPDDVPVSLKDWAVRYRGYSPNTSRSQLVKRAQAKGIPVDIENGVATIPLCKIYEFPFKGNHI